ncbi:hypothetical protein DRW07_07890 [Alteromonas sediminis]|uniref:NrS-1 polymerase-like HBD domain-containing protein n=1 Tax=Alteromonas sediminis TaxID=2259342 RepID=A0A3N5Y2X9_9ALTE|nr:AAA family ATPase [Alteromonas sediminis]RPJ67433.1 hypothetical protein DRW07_07890 [Alteromonas sediminis]
MNTLAKYMKWSNKTNESKQHKHYISAANNTSFISTEGGMDDNAILGIMFNAANGDAVKKLYEGDVSAHNNDSSAADLALVNHIAFYTQTPKQIDRIFRTSALFQEKWDDVHSADGRTYGEMTITKALSDLSNTYSSPSRTKVQTEAKEFQFVNGAEIIKRSGKTDWLIENYIPSDATVLIFGNPASGKSLIALDMACCIGSGRDWEGNTVKQGNVAYIAGEGFNGLSKRLRAVSEAKDLEVKHFYSSEISMDLMERGSVDLVRKAVRGINDLRLIIIDTLHRNSTGEENSSKDFSVILKHCDLLRNATGATIMLVHHSGHSDQKRSRGSSSIKGAMDAEFKVSQSPQKVVTLECTKMKDDKKSESIKFDLKTVITDYDDDGEPIAGPLLEKSTTYFKTDKTAVMKGKNALALDILRELAGANGEPVNKANWRDCFIKRSNVKPDSKDPVDAKRTQFKRAVKSLKENGLVIEDNGSFSIADSDASTEEDNE